MNIKSILFISILFLTACHSSKAPKGNGNEFTIVTNYGDIQIRLYDETPLHRDNFRKLVQGGFYDGLLFHRTIQNFMIQAGDPNSREAYPGMGLGDADAGYTIPAEIVNGFFHRNGVLAAARLGDNVNPERASSGSQFFIVYSNPMSTSELDKLVEDINNNRRSQIFMQYKNQYAAQLAHLEANFEFDSVINITEHISELTAEAFEKQKMVLSKEQRNIYTTVGGSPALDGAYTIFGEVTKGLDVVAKIEAAPTDGNDRPIKDVIIKEIH